MVGVLTFNIQTSLTRLAFIDNNNRTPKQTHYTNTPNQTLYRSIHMPTVNKTHHKIIAPHTYIHTKDNIITLNYCILIGPSLSTFGKGAKRP